MPEPIFTSLNERGKYKLALQLLALFETPEEERTEFWDGAVSMALETWMNFTGETLERDARTVRILLAVAKQYVDIMHGFHGLN